MRLRTLFASVLSSALIFGGHLGAQTQSPIPYDTVQVNGISMAYRVVGEGEPLVLLHGLTQTGASWNRVIEDFSQDYRVIVPDLRGHGYSTNPTRLFRHLQVASDVFALLDTLGVQTFKGIGVSTGAMTLLHLATSEPARVEAMVLIGGTSYFPEEARAIQRTAHPDSMDLDYLENLGRSHPRGVEQAREVLGYLYAFHDNHEDMSFTPPRLATISARTLIMHGDRDQFFPVSIPVQQYEAIPNSYLWILPNTGHVPVITSDRGKRLYWETLIAFLAGEWS
jgi:pimeloyl-ACP methyl ester carboxylesterase